MCLFVVCCLFIYYCYCLGQGDKLVNTCLRIILHVVYKFVYF